MLSLSEKLEQINKLRKEALSNPEFVRSAKAHAQAIDQQEKPFTRNRKKAAKPKSFADVYRDSSFPQSSFEIQS